MTHVSSAVWVSHMDLWQVVASGKEGSGGGRGPVVGGTSGGKGPVKGGDRWREGIGEGRGPVEGGIGEGRESVEGGDRWRGGPVERGDR